MRDLEVELDEERKQKVQILAGKKKMEMDLQEMENQIDGANKGREEAVKQLKKLQVILINFNLVDGFIKLLKGCPSARYGSDHREYIVQVCMLCSNSISNHGAQICHLTPH